MMGLKSLGYYQALQTQISLDGVSILKSKNQKWITFNCKMLWERDFKNPNNWISNTYYSELEPII